MQDLSKDEIKKIDKIIKKSRRKKKVKRKWRFSEKVILFILIFSISVFLSAIGFAFTREDSSVWAYLLPSIGALASSAFAVFVWKEKNENLPKIIANPSYDEDQMKEQVQYEVEEEYRNLGR